MKKIKKFIICFSIILSVLLCSSFSVFASDYTVVDFCWSQPTVSDDLCYFEIVQQSGASFVLVCRFSSTGGDYRAVYEPTFSLNDDKTILTVYLTRISWDTNVESLSVSISGANLYNDGSYFSYGSHIGTSVSFVLNYGSSSNSSIVSFKPYGIICSDSYSWGLTSDYVFNYTDDYVLEQKLDSILSALGGSGAQGPAQSDKDIIDNTEAQQDELLDNTNPTQKIDSLQTELMSFVNSAPNTLIVAKSIFDRLVSGNVGVIVFGSVCLAIFPLLINVIKGRGG